MGAGLSKAAAAAAAGKGGKKGGEGQWTAAGHWKETQQRLPSPGTARAPVLRSHAASEASEHAGKCGHFFISPTVDARKGLKITAWRRVTGNLWPPVSQMATFNGRRAIAAPPLSPSPHGCRLSTLASPHLYIRLQEC